MRSSLEFSWTPIPSLLVYALYRFDTNHQNNKVEHAKLAAYFNMKNGRTIESKLSNFKWLDTNGKSGLKKYAAVAKVIESRFKKKTNSELKKIYDEFFITNSLSKKLNDDLANLSLSWLSEMPFNKFQKYLEISGHHGVDFSAKQNEIDDLLISKAPSKLQESRKSISLDSDDLVYVNSVNESIGDFDISTLPSEKPTKVRVNGSDKWPRDKRVGKAAIKVANYKCELDASHTTFTSGSNLVQYMEPHHLIPISNQDKFAQRLDIVENIVSLCPNCHCQIHYAEKSDRENIIDALFILRSAALASRGITITANLMKKLY